MAKTKTSYKPGQSGNPKGRPKGSRNKLATLARSVALDLFPVLKKQAKEGNTDALKFLIGLGVPRSKPMEIDPENQATLSKILQKLRNGEETLENTALDLCINGIEVPDILKIMLQREEPMPEDDGVYSTLSNEEMENLVRERLENIRKQSTEWLEERRADVNEMKKDIENAGKDSFAPELINQGVN